MKKFKYGYTQGVYDMFHIGHLNLLNHAKEQCEHLTVGVNSDRMVKEYKDKLPVISQEERRAIVSNVKAVDKAIIADTLDKVSQWKQMKFDAIFIGSDWKGNSRWEETREKLSELGVEVVFLPHTDGISSTHLRVIESERIEDE